MKNKNETAKKKLASQHIAKKKMKKAGIVVPTTPKAKVAEAPKGKGKEKAPLKELTSRRVASYTAPTEKLLSEYRDVSKLIKFNDPDVRS